MEKIDLVIEFIIKNLEERRDNQKIHRFLRPKCKQCEERDDFIERLKDSLSHGRSSQ